MCRKLVKLCYLAVVLPFGVSCVVSRSPYPLADPQNASTQRFRESPVLSTYFAMKFDFCNAHVNVIVFCSLWWGGNKSVWVCLGGIRKEKFRTTGTNYQTLLAAKFAVNEFCRFPFSFCLFMQRHDPSDDHIVPVNSFLYYGGSAKCPHCPRKDWRGKSCRLHPLESNPTYRSNKD